MGVVDMAPATFREPGWDLDSLAKAQEGVDGERGRYSVLRWNAIHGEDVAEANGVKDTLGEEAAIHRYERERRNRGLARVTYEALKGGAGVCSRLKGISTAEGKGGVERRINVWKNHRRWVREDEGPSRGTGWGSMESHCRGG